jgi:hypothetical protein
LWLNVQTFTHLSAWGVWWESRERTERVKGVGNFEVR